METKTCRICNKAYGEPHKKWFSSLDSNCRTGLDSRCKLCRAKIDKARYRLKRYGEVAPKHEHVFDGPSI